jgi:hypothetical protein
VGLLAITLRRRVLQTSAPYLGDGEVLQAVFPAVTADALHASGWEAFYKQAREGRRLIVVTDRRVLVFRCGANRSSTLKELLRELPRTTPIEFASTRWFRVAREVSNLGEPLWVYWPFRAEVRKVQR